MKIDRRLNIVIGIDGEDGKTIHVHAAPIPQSVFETYFLIMSRTFTAIYAGGLGAVSGPRVAAMMLKKVAMQADEWEDVEKGLIGEIKRLASVITLGDKGWSTLPLDLALQRGVLDERDTSEVMNALVFFTLISSISRKPDLLAAIGGMERLWGAQSVSLNSTEYAASLPISTATVSSGATAIPSSIPA